MHENKKKIKSLTIHSFKKISLQMCLKITDICHLLTFAKFTYLEKMTKMDSCY